jgi:CheY-like chemotaxis protein
MADLKPILLVEDSANDIELKLAALEENHLANEVVVVRDGAEALGYLYQRGAFKLRGRGNPAVVLLDLKLPKVDGLEVLRAIKEDPDMKCVPVVMLTSSREEQDLASRWGLRIFSSRSGSWGSSGRWSTSRRRAACSGNADAGHDYDRL